MSSTHTNAEQKAKEDYEYREREKKNQSSFDGNRRN